MSAAYNYWVANMHKQQSLNMKNQSGAILVLSLVLLVAISLLSVASMKSSRDGLRMAQNDESRLAAEQGALALADAVIGDPTTTPVVGDAGFSICTPAETGCDRNDLTLANPVIASKIASGVLSGRIQRMDPPLRTPPRGIESSIDKFIAAPFEVTVTFDRTNENLGRQTMVEGVLVLAPK